VRKIGSNAGNDRNLGNLPTREQERCAQGFKRRASGVKKK
jgi:hypothetical protein